MAQAGSKGQGAFVAAVTLAVATLGGAIVVLGMPPTAEALLSLSGSADGAPALVEAVYLLCLFLPLVALALIGGRFTDVNPLALGDRPAVRIAIGFGMGLGGLLLALLHGRIAGTLGYGPDGLAGIGLFVAGTLLILVQTSAEEIFFRGWLQPVLVRHWGKAAGVIVAAIAFALLHIAGGGASNPVSLVNLFLGGLLFGMLALQHGGIASAAAAHFAWNWSEAMLLGLSPNPGIGSFGALIDYELSGTGLWGGSDEGLNASLGMTAALLALLVLLLTRAGRRAPSPPAPAAA